MSEHAREAGSSAAEQGSARTGNLPGSMLSFTHLLRPHRTLLLLSVLLLVVNRACALVLPASLAFLLDRVVAHRDLHALPGVLAVVLLATGAAAATDYALVVLLGRTGHVMTANLRTQVQEHVGHLPLRFFDARSKGSLTSRLMKDAAGIRDLLGTGTVGAAGALVTGVLAFATLLRLDPKLALPLVPALALYGFSLRRLARGISACYQGNLQKEDQVSGRLTESLGGVRVVKGYGAEAREAELFRAGFRSLRDSGIALAARQARLTLGSSMALFLIGLAGLYAGFQQVLAGELTLGRLVGFFAVLGYASGSASQLALFPMHVAGAYAALARSNQLLAQSREDHDPARIQSLPEVRGLLRFRDVSFSYSPSVEVLHGISFDARPGSVTALVGASGAGKTTVSALACGFYTPTAGQVTIDGIDLATVPPGDFRDHLGVVLQEPFLFSGTVWQNVLFARPTASEAEVRRACLLAHVDEFVERFPAGFETLVGERGIRLSGGQQQRLCMARALLRDPRLLILDEATSSLDAESEAYIQQSLAELSPGRTTLVIAHRLSTIRRADQILVLEAGRIVERGTHDDLLAANGRYADLFSRVGHQGSGHRAR